ncbi:acyl-CoA dehydrogenase family protein [Actinomadura parmotrematis]|uniref:Acyl-CoA dehydrogenase/oxidase C-terminal domain-containing protein n=1 Tax=Actinomadura parmotrematis TaxID=2864039 RepID=A0ABS7FL07_9ACTN|nr:acyl-CoA dehydrogenase [Actinomadura parmotrematis]MBW8481053.1 hypothetical protein [Actinomadura parmotrematis]
MDDLLAATADRIFAGGGDVWAALTAAGLTTVGVPEDAGGSGGTLEDAAAVLRTAGYRAAAVPLAETGWLAGRLLAEAGLPLPDGPLTAAAADDLARVPWARDARGIAVVNGDRLDYYERGRFDAAPGANLAGEPRDRVVLGPEPTASGPCTADLRTRGALARAVQLTGALRRALDLTVRYAGEREQFGRPLGRFQAVQQAVAELAGEAVVADVAVRAAVRAPDDPVAVAAAKANASRAAGTAAAIAHQVHGALGVTAEHPLHTVTLRLWSWREEYGSEHAWAAELGGRATAASPLWPFLIGA